MKRGIILTCSLSLLLLFSSAASAATITFGYSATGSGGTVTGTFGYDNSAPDANPSPTGGNYDGAGFWTGTVVGGPQGGAVFNFLPPSRLRVFLGAATHVFDIGGSVTFLSLVDTSATVFVNDSLPSMLTLSDYSIAQMFLTNGDISLPGTTQVEYTLQSITKQSTTNPVPEPSTMILLGTGLAGILAWRRNKVA